MARIIDGKKISAAVRAEIAERAEKLKEESGVTPGLAVILVGDDPASAIYVRNKEKACADAAIDISAATIGINSICFIALTPTILQR